MTNSRTLLALLNPRTATAEDLARFYSKISGKPVTPEMVERFRTTAEMLHKASADAIERDRHA